MSCVMSSYLDLIFSIIFPIYILVTISNDFPDFFDNTLSTRENVGKFYIHQQNFAPRDPKIENTFDIDAQKLRFKRIFLQEMNAKNNSSSKRCSSVKYNVVWPNNRLKLCITWLNACNIIYPIIYIYPMYHI